MISSYAQWPWGPDNGLVMRWLHGLRQHAVSPHRFTPPTLWPSSCYLGDHLWVFMSTFYSFQCSWIIIQASPTVCDVDCISLITAGPPVFAAPSLSFIPWGRKYPIYQFKLLILHVNTELFPECYDPSDRSSRVRNFTASMYLAFFCIHFPPRLINGFSNRVVLIRICHFPSPPSFWCGCSDANQSLTLLINMGDCHHGVNDVNLLRGRRLFERVGPLLTVSLLWQGRIAVSMSLAWIIIWSTSRIHLRWRTSTISSRVSLRPVRRLPFVVHSIPSETYPASLMLQISSLSLSPSSPRR